MDEQFDRPNVGIKTRKDRTGLAAEAILSNNFPSSKEIFMQNINKQPGLCLEQKRTVVDYIFRPWITKKDGTRIYAKQYGKKVFRIPVYDDAMKK